METLLFISLPVLKVFALVLAEICAAILLPIVADWIIDCFESIFDNLKK